VRSDREIRDPHAHTRTRRRRSKNYHRADQGGYTNQLLLSQDICAKTSLNTYGGTGCAFILERLAPYLKLHGVSDAEMHDFPRSTRTATFWQALPRHLLQCPSAKFRSQKSDSALRRTGNAERQTETPTLLAPRRVSHQRVPIILSQGSCRIDVADAMLEARSKRQGR